MKLGNTFKSAAAIFGVLTLGLATSANAATANTTIAVSATVVATCTISATGLGFGNYTGALNTATATITVTCTNTTPWRVGLDAGLATGATVTTRKMNGTGTASGQTLSYGLYQDSGHNTNWGNTPGTDTPASVNGTGSAQTVTVFGQIPANQLVTPGSYGDTITATVNY